MNRNLSRPEFFKLQNGPRWPLPFSDQEYHDRLSALRNRMDETDISAVLLTSLHNIAYFSGFLYCSFGRHYGCVVTMQDCITISANIDFGQPWRRSYGDNLTYTDWKCGNYWRAVAHVLGGNRQVGIEADHMTLQSKKELENMTTGYRFKDMGRDIMRLRMIKSDEEMALIRGGARIADIGGRAIRDSIRPGVREIDVAMAGRNAMETAIAEAYPDSELRDTWVWFQSGMNTDGAHNPVTTRQLERGDILSLNAFPMISGYYTALERTLFLGEVDEASLVIWQGNVQTHERGLSLVRPGVKCSEICEQLNQCLESLGLLQYRTFGYGHSFGLLSHYYGRETDLELREDMDTVLEPNMVISMEPMLTVPEGNPAAGGYREHDILVVTENGADNLSGFPYGPEFNVVCC